LVTADTPIERPILPAGDDLPGDLLVALGRTLAAEAPPITSPAPAPTATGWTTLPTA
jgi:hypothetical protein